MIKISSASLSIFGHGTILGPYLSSALKSGLPTPLNTLLSYIFPSKKYFGWLYSTSISQAEVSLPLFAAVAAMLLASIRATEAICPLPGLLPSLLGKFLVECLIENAPLAGTSPAPKQGPQKADLTRAPVSIRVATVPFLTSSIYTGWLAG